jgi:CheY-like chemotaxis protein
MVLQPRAEFKVVGEAIDGLEAISKATELQPDLILLDIGLPQLNGIAAAEQIRSLTPNAKILFVSLESSASMVQEAFRCGGQGYIDKARAQFDLVPGIETVLSGRQFVSDTLELERTPATQRRHEVQFYSDETVFLEGATRFIGTALKAHASVIVLATPEHEHSIRQILKAADTFDIDHAIRQRTYVSLNAVEVLSKVVVNGRIDHGVTTEVVTNIVVSTIKAAKARNARTAIWGECCGLLCAEGNFDAVIEMEKRANVLIDAHDVDIFCPYPLSALQTHDQTRAFKDICSEHTAVFSH